MALSQRRRRILGRLTSAKSRRKEGLVLVEGVRAASEALDAGAEVRFAVVSPRLRGSPEGSALLTRLHAAGTDLDEASDREIGEVADTEHPQGLVLACAEPPSDASQIRPGGRYLVLDALQDPGNAGTLVRAAVAFGLDGVIGLDGTVDLWGTKAVRASAGMAFRIPLIHLDEGALFHHLDQAGLALFAASSGGGDVADWSPSQGWALAVGNEGRGCRDRVLERSTGRLEVPMPGPAESLNAGVAGSILLYAMTRAGARAEAP